MRFRRRRSFRRGFRPRRRFSSRRSGGFRSRRIGFRM